MTTGILFQCAACAAPLGLNSGKKCGRCSTRYCGPACQEQHWKEGGHDKLCRKIKKGGGAEQYHADKKYKEAVAVAVEKCVDDTKGKTCYICTQALHWKTKEGLVRMCACGDRDGVASGTTGIAHVSCLAEQAKILVTEAEENNLGLKVINERWPRWHTCSLCEQEYHGVVKCALGWACWREYGSRELVDDPRRVAMMQLGCGLAAAGHGNEALSVRVASLALQERCWPDEKHNIARAQQNLADSFFQLGLHDEALEIERKLFAESSHDPFISAQNLGSTLITVARNKEAAGRHSEVMPLLLEARTLLQKTIVVAERTLCPEDYSMLSLRLNYLQTILFPLSTPEAERREAMAAVEGIAETARRVFGREHHITKDAERTLRNFARTF